MGLQLVFCDLQHLQPLAALLFIGWKSVERNARIFIGWKSVERDARIFIGWKSVERDARIFILDLVRKLHSHKFS